MGYRDLGRDELLELQRALRAQYESAKAEGLKLDMSRGKPCPEQLDLSMPMLDVLSGDSNLTAEDGADCRNYGDMDGIPEAKRLLGGMMGVEEDEVFVGGSSSLNLMHDLLGFCYLHPLPGCGQPWGKQGTIKFLCPSPGYDRHFNATQHFGIELVTVPMTATGPDMDAVERLARDPQVKGMWCVPKYSNPEGIIYSQETVERLAAMKTADDFRIFWDNAYALHDLHPDRAEQLPNLLEALRRRGNEDRMFQFCSFAKVTFGGGGLAAIGASKANIAFIKQHMSLQLICNDKVNQLRHVRFFGDLDGLRRHMAKQAEILRPKFALVQKILREHLADADIASWTDPQGGYFVSLDTLDGCAKRTVTLCKEAGVVMTPAGATFPYGVDPADRNIRIAPSYPGLDELGKAAELLCLCVKIATVETLLTSNYSKRKK